MELEVGKVTKKKVITPLIFSFHFENNGNQKFVLGLPKSEFSTGKKHITSGKKSGKNYLAPSEKYACYTRGVVEQF